MGDSVDFRIDQWNFIAVVCRRCKLTNIGIVIADNLFKRIATSLAPHSYRKAIMGSTFAARRAGI